eukprot:g4978.t1
MSSFRYVVLGGGNASGYAANRFIKNGVNPEEICVITDEPVVAYERPALSKGFLFPDNPARLPGFHTCVGMGLERQDAEWYKDKKMEYKTNTKVTSVSISDKSLTTESGDTIQYEKLIVATGARPVYLTDFKVPGAELEGIYYLRNFVDGEALVAGIAKAKAAGNKAVVIGGGYIGMECAAALCQNGLEVTMVFPENFMMSRLFTPEIAKFYEDVYESKGIVLTKGTLVSSLEGTNGKVTTAVLNTGTKLPADIVLVGTGARANSELFKDQLELVAGGIKVNSQLQSSNPDVYAIGDVAAFPLIRYNAPHQRQEHVTNCRLTAFHAVDALTNPDSTGEYNYLPYFYSRVFHLSWQFYGENKGDVVVFGDQSSGKFGCYWVDGGKVVGVFLESGSGDENKAIKAIAELRPDAPSNLNEQGINFALDHSK